ncbi:HNH endonuclease family protein [Arcanobacterium phocae]|uniref:HNH endonuclease family protein n=1 Tax=Arcanobacterium phocae TaxID=131112 RepID=UPI001C0EE03F|nr:HNH endonuclease family protein [Arcanobacterium phocae]
MFTRLVLSAALSLAPVGIANAAPNDDLAPRASQALTFLETGLSQDIPDPHNGLGYTGNRTKLFGTPWKDMDHNQCDTRNDILARDLTNVDFSPRPGVQTREQGIGQGVRKCKNATVYSGTLEDPYTGQTIQFDRAKNASKVQIDHVIPLGYAYRHGAWKLAQEGKKKLLEEFANDPINLVAVEQRANIVKSDKGPAEWMPDNTSYRCEYAVRMSEVLQKYNSVGFTLGDQDKKSLIHTLQTECGL